MGSFAAYAAGLALLLCLSAFFSSSETALCSLTRAQHERLRTETIKSSIAIVRFTEDQKRLFITILLGNTFVNIAFATITAGLTYELFGGSPSGPAIATATGVITLALLIFGEITPKTFAIRNAEAFSRISAPPLWAFSVLIYPLRKLIRKVVDLLLPLFGGGGADGDEPVTPQDVRDMVDTVAAGSLTDEERKLLGRVLDLREIDASEVMVPRTEMARASTSATIDEVLAVGRETGRSRIPLYRTRIDDICGVFHIKDWLHWRTDNVRDLTIEEFLVHRAAPGFETRSETLVRPALFTPAGRKIVAVLNDLARERTKMGIVLDEYGGVAGCLTFEDIVEEVVGDIVDERDAPLPTPGIVPHRKTADAFHVAGRVGIRRINRRFGLALNPEIADTIGGYVTDRIGGIPSPGESIECEGGVTFTVSAVEDNRVTGVVLRLVENNGDSG